jgi:putative membrane protein
MKQISIALAIAGLLLATGLIAWFGASGVLQAVLSVGWSGFIGYTCYQLALVCVLGLCWQLLVPGVRAAALPVFIWGRMIRDAAGQFLPFSQVGGVVMSSRAVTLFGIGGPTALASTLADVSTEFLAQLVFAVLGLLVLLSREPHSELIWPLAAGLAVALALLAGFVVMQQGALKLFDRLTSRIAAPWLEKVAGQVGRLQSEFDVIYRRPVMLALVTAMHLLTWFGTAGASWIAFHLLGAHIDFRGALAIEALLHAGLTVTFMVPGAAGVQELIYTSLGAVFGIPPEIALAVSLLRRARDLAIGIPVLLGWQYLEARRLRRA